MVAAAGPNGVLLACCITHISVPKEGTVKKGVKFLLLTNSLLSGSNTQIGDSTSMLCPPGKCCYHIQASMLKLSWPFHVHPHHGQFVETVCVDGWMDGCMHHHQQHHGTHI